MIDRILYINENQIRIIFTHRPPFEINTDDGSAFRLLDELLAPPSPCQPRTLSEFRAIVQEGEEITQAIELEKIG